MIDEICINKKGFEFLKKLKKNNNRDWFIENRALYEENLKIPVQNVVRELGRVLKAKAPGFNFDPKRSIFRINRDVRFSENKEPYKTNIGASFVVSQSSKKEEAPGLYLHIEPGNCFIGGGLYMPTGDQLRKIRELINRDPAGFKKIITSTKVKKEFGGLTGEKLKRAPRGISDTHPSIELLKWKQFVFIKHYKDQDFQKGNLARVVQQDYELMLPLVKWLNKAMGLW